jgi:hypothetical protein
MDGAIGRTGVNRLGLHPCVGYYDDSEAGEPVYDPGWGATPCLICFKPLGGEPGANVGGNIRTVNVLHGDDNLSMFYRVHISCADAHPDEMEAIDASVMHGPRAA